MNKTYQQPKSIKVIAWIMIILMTPIILAFGYEYLAGRVAEAGQSFILLLFLAPFYVGSWWLLWQFNGRFHLTDYNLILEQLGRTTTIPYDNIVGLEARSQPAPCLRLRTTDNKKLTILFQTEHFSDLYTTLNQKVTALQQADNVAFPLKLQLTARHYRQTILPIIYSLLFLAVLTISLLNEIPTLTSGQGLLFLGFILLMIVLYLLFTHSRSPTAVTFSNSTIQTRTLFGKQKEWPVSTIKQIQLEREKMTFRSVPYIATPLVITFANEQKMILEDKRIWEFGYAPDHLYKLVARHYQTSLTAV